jgi:hypothetical protein
MARQYGGIIWRGCFGVVLAGASESLMGQARKKR